jgi:hypothetical protein
VTAVVLEALHTHPVSSVLNDVIFPRISLLDKLLVKKLSFCYMLMVSFANVTCLV